MTAGRLSGEEYVDAMSQVALACRLLLNLDIEYGETIGPVLDPTGFATGGAANLAQARKILAPAIALRDAAHGLDPALVAARSRP